MTSYPPLNPRFSLEADDDVPLLLKSFSKLFNGFCDPNTAALLDDDENSWDSADLQDGVVKNSRSSDTAETISTVKDWASFEREGRSSVRSLSSFEHRITFQHEMESSQSLLSPQANDIIKLSNDVHNGTPETMTSTVGEESDTNTDDTTSVPSPLQNTLPLVDEGNIEIVLSPLASPPTDVVDAKVATSDANKGNKFNFSEAVEEVEHDTTNASVAEREAEIEEIISHINQELVEKLSAEAAAQLDAKIDAILESPGVDILAAIHSNVNVSDGGDEPTENLVETHIEAELCEATADLPESESDVEVPAGPVSMDSKAIEDSVVDKTIEEDDDESELESLPDVGAVYPNKPLTPTRVLFPSKFRIGLMEAKPERPTRSSIKRVLIVGAVHTIVHCGVMSAGMYFLGTRS